ncbi:MAG: hypothetical protein PUB46_08555 [Lachnospiraceae bacterium]|nr:hypothetical protein [Lachnospiraceae bacterium]MDD6170113.1 hypothetical protein [Lachnospiraceae bacterium]MDY4838590.1 hypothetical protein [Lachnospiraceae bacterium]
MFELKNETIEKIEKKNATYVYLLNLKDDILIPVSVCSVCKNGCKGACKTTCSNNITGKRGN